MSREASPAFQFYPSDFLTDEKVMAMTLAQRGAYITLLCICWREGSIPDDPRQIRNLLSCPQILMSAVWKSVRSCFTERDGRLIQGRLERERRKQENYRKNVKEAGRLGGLASSQRRAEIQASLKRGSSDAQAKGVANSSSSSSTLYKNPPTPLKRGAVRFTRKELQTAKEIRARVFGRCPHDPRCPNYDACLRAIALERQQKAAAP